MTEPGKTENTVTAKSTPKQQIDLPASDIFKVAVLACFGSGARFDAIERMKIVGINLLTTAIKETASQPGKMEIINQTVQQLTASAGLESTQPEEKTVKEPKD